MAEWMERLQVWWYKQGAQLAERFGPLWKQVRDLLVRKLFSREEEDVVYDDGSGRPEVAKDVLAQRTIRLTFGIYGSISGLLMQNYAAYLIRAFNAWAAGVKITSSDIPSSALTILMAIVIVGIVYTAGVVIAGFLYFSFKKVFVSALDDVEQSCQEGFMLCVLAMIVATILGILLPWNLFLIGKM